MKRPIKFRGKDLVKRIWVYGYYVSYITPEEGEIHCVIDEEGRWITVDPESVGQFIKRNKKGEELYEGDILSAHSDSMLLFYEKGSFVAKSMTKHWKVSFANAYTNYDLIGNRFDNDELL